MKAIQIIKGKKQFVIIEVLYGLADSGYSLDMHLLGHTLSHSALMGNKDTVMLPTINTTDKEVRRVADMNKLN